MNNLDRIATDHEMAIKKLNAKELSVGLNCAKRVRTHIKKQVNRESGSRYFYNLLVLETIIRSYENALDELPKPQPRPALTLQRQRVTA